MNIAHPCERFYRYPSLWGSGYTLCFLNISRLLSIRWVFKGWGFRALRRYSPDISWWLTRTVRHLEASSRTYHALVLWRRHALQGRWKNPRSNFLNLQSLQKTLLRSAAVFTDPVLWGNNTYIDIFTSLSKTINYTRRRWQGLDSSDLKRALGDGLMSL